MKVSKLTIRGGDGRLLNDTTFVNAPDLADQRTERILRHHPDAVVERTDTEERGRSDY